MPGLVMIGPVVWAVGELYTQAHTHTHTHTNATTLYIQIHEKKRFAVEVERSIVTDQF